MSFSLLRLLLSAVVENKELESVVVEPVKI